MPAPGGREEGRGGEGGEGGDGGDGRGHTHTHLARKWGGLVWGGEGVPAGA